MPHWLLLSNKTTIAKKKNEKKKHEIRNLVKTYPVPAMITVNDVGFTAAIHFERDRCCGAIITAQWCI